MSDTTDPELCSLITNVYKPPKNFDFPDKLKSLKSLHGLIIIGGRVEPIACLVFYLLKKCGNQNW